MVQQCNVVNLSVLANCRVELYTIRDVTAVYLKCSVSIVVNRQSIPRNPCRQTLWLADTWHATELQATEEEPDLCYQDGVDV